MTDHAARSRFLAVQGGLLDFLRAYENEQERVCFGEGTASQARLRDTAGDFFDHRVEEYCLHAPAPEARSIQVELCACLADFAAAYRIYLGARGTEWNRRMLDSRLAMARGLEKLYPIRGQLPLLRDFWCLAPARGDLRVPDRGAGVRQVAADGNHGGYSLFLPGQYAADREWPLIVALHGGYGSGRELIWSWVRPAASAGYLLVAPHSRDVTWSILNPARDIQSLRAILTELAVACRVDARQVFLTGLSDGATFAYLFGFTHPELFAGVAPVAGEMHEIGDSLVRGGAGRELPLYVVHGARDHIFPVATQRSTTALLQRLGYRVTYDELPDWGHAYPYRINEQRLLPWFESLRVSP